MEEVNLNLLELQERLRAEGSQGEDEGEKPAGGREEPEGLQGMLAEELPEHREYPLETACLVWGKGLAVHPQRQSLGDAVRWYLEERPGEGAQLLKERRIRVEIVDQAYCGHQENIL